MKVGIIGTGQFAPHFVPLFQVHPLVTEVVLCDIDPDKLARTAQRFGIKTTYSSLDDICESDVDAVAIFTQNWLHGPQAIQALEAGKHVYSAVPSAISMTEIESMVKTVTKSGRIYMVGETSYYYPHVIYCRQKYKEGAFGTIVHGEAEYYHDFDSLYDVMKWRGGKDWLKTAGSPPMYYPTHSISQIVSVTGARMTHVSCQGFVDPVDDQVFKKNTNQWANEFSNESALFKMSDGSSCRINEFRRVGHQGLSERMSLFGTKASFEQNSGGSVWVEKYGVKPIERLDHLFEAIPAKRNSPDEKREGMELLADDSFLYETAPIHDTSRLPESFKGLPNAHYGSHQFLVDDFIVSCATGELPPNNIWQAARYLVPGLIAHESALQGGKLLQVPDFGDAPRSLSEL
ncbi:Gfo/Idh/MocA family protein [Paenibacillus sp. GCM10027626]|uniref:Gfo/Idh/MocA family protein n=1 Tax=Paenibacillus sp. GCM10027626 TaxID=3273411 RepID=UPI00362F603E